MSGPWEPGTSTIFISHSRRDAELVQIIDQALRNVGHVTIIEEFIPKEQKSEVPYEEIRTNVQRSNYLFLFLTDNIVATEYTRNWVSYEVGLASAAQKRLFVFERVGFPLPYPIPYATDYMLFDEKEIGDILDIQTLAKKISEINPSLIGGGTGALLGVPFGPIGMFVGGILGAALGSLAIQPVLRLRCRKCRTPFNYWSPQMPNLHCPCCRQFMDVTMKDGVV